MKNFVIDRHRECPKSKATNTGMQEGERDSGFFVRKPQFMNATATAISSAVNYIQPLEDERWNEFVQGHPHSSIFHSIGWLEALRRTYGYRPNVITTSPAGENIQNGLVFCEVNSWLSGRRLVSLPFSDHCEPLVDNIEELSVLLSALEKRSHNESMRYVEIRPLREIVPSIAVFQSTYRYYLHKIDLTAEYAFGNTCFPIVIDRNEVTFALCRKPGVVHRRTCAAPTLLKCN